MDRRNFLKTIPAAALALSGPALLNNSAAEAAAPFAKNRAPGFYRMPLGDYEITALSDGTIPLPLDKLYRGTTPEHVEEALGEVFLKLPAQVSVNAYLVNTGDRLVLIDAGTGSLLGPSLGKVPQALAAAGYRPEQVDAVILTHIHTDHSGGLMLDGARVFPNATVHVNRREVDYWLDAARRAAAPEAKRSMFDEAAASVKSYEKAGRLKTFGDNEDPIPGFRSIWRPGHTPGHSSIVVESGGETFVAWGDITHGDVLQFDEPKVTIDFDEDPVQAANNRKAAFAEAVEQRYWVAGAHIAFPGIGHVRTDSTEYDWVPANYRAG
ncbi:MBL fold metallo-hydrolase [Phyllobacterium salinisoli]|uniref:MBL fold metallo-hydrolase n=1 Tax=Phyllobacterium salinisoli TaxID=1899321 RepID=A0A368JX69_9HYPH|nr:MBL fold metallo-hydrolase [Phyllobacterium salinisoli]RCS21758.1 MBL fold metallo-hydrolase [Phyllobacterium salinisoli]